MPFKLRYIIILCAAFSALSAFGDDLSETAIGTWKGACDAWGTPATCTSIWRRGIHPSHLVQEYTIQRSSDGAQLFAGRGLYRLRDGEVEGVWEDSRGEILSLAGRAEDRTLRVIWGDATTEIGRSSYVFSDAGMSARDSVLSDEGWREFMAIDYDRLDTSSPTE